MEVHHHDVGLGGLADGRPRRSSPRRSGQRAAPGHSRAPTLTAAQAAADGSTSSSARSPVVVVVAAHRRQASELLGAGPARPRRRGRAAALAAGGELGEALQAEVVGPALQDGPVERRVEVLGEEGQVLAGQLVLERLGGGGHDRLAPGEDGGHQVGQRLARAGARLDDEVASRCGWPRATASAISTWPGRASPAGRAAVTRARASGIWVGRADMTATQPTGGA